VLPPDLQKERESRSLALLDERNGWALERLTDDEFTRLLQLDQVREERIKKIIANRLQEGVHYGKVTGIDRPFAWEPAADEIGKLFRLSFVLSSDPLIYRDGEYVEATVAGFVRDLSGRPLATAVRSCCTAERRFRKGGEGKPKFKDARECVNEVVSMATKRAKVAAMLAAAGAKPFFASPELLEAEEAEVISSITPWTEDEKTKVYRAVKDIGIKTAGEFAKFATEVLGRTEIGTGEDVARLMAEVEVRKFGKGAPTEKPAES